MALRKCKRRDARPMPQKLKKTWTKEHTYSNIDFPSSCSKCPVVLVIRASMDMISTQYRTSKLAKTLPRC